MKYGIRLAGCALVVTCLPSALQAQETQAPVTVEFVMKNNDLNKDGIITREEATRASRQLVRNWEIFDANMDDKVDVDEIRAGLLATQGSAPETDK